MTWGGRGEVAWGGRGNMAWGGKGEVGGVRWPGMGWEG